MSIRLLLFRCLLLQQAKTLAVAGEDQKHVARNCADDEPLEAAVLVVVTAMVAESGRHSICATQRDMCTNLTESLTAQLQEHSSRNGYKKESTSNFQTHDGTFPWDSKRAPTSAWLMTC